ncbi:hypothetical protein [Butyrivibrio sp. AE2005]|uniref:hypothetical protein n=1 Tax=Butyrivibrio sp. AE2005 TaxID=1496722 RepID=UPI00047C6F16|nr:hypothetical protein [Butyrivibrio sp. AE2005]
MMRKTIVILMVVIMVMLTACGAKLYTEGNAQGYTSINDIEGILFSMYSKTVGNATAVTNISEKMNFEKDQTYLYKNGESEYLLFNISSVVLAVEKGTDFNMANAKDKKEAVTSHDLLGIWFDIPKKKLSYTDNTADGTYKFIATVNGGVSVTSEIYNDFAGKLVVISDGTDEWSLFIGSVGTDYDSLSDDIKDTINYIAASLKIADKEKTQDTVAVSLGGQTTENDSEVKDSSMDASLEVSIEEGDEAAVNASTENTSEEPMEESSSDASFEEISADSSSTTDNSNEDSTSEDEVEIIEVDSSSIDFGDDKPDDEKDDDVDTPEESADATEADEQETKRGEIITLNNQKEEEKADNKIYNSSVYDMLKPGNWGYADVQTGKIKETVAVKVSSLCTAQEAVNLIKKACTEKVVPYSYFEAPVGCSWHLVKVEDQGKKGYLNIKVVGADGNKLTFRGIKYPMRTYMLDFKDEVYAYYAVPNGCSEYVLEVGDGTISNELASAYYLIDNY